MTSTPLVLASPGRANDAAFLAAADLSEIAAELAVEYRLVGGNAVSLLTAVHEVSNRVPPRETADADFGAEYQVIADPRLLKALLHRGYLQSEGNRFTRTHTLASLDATTDPVWDLVIDVLAPSYEGRLVSNQSHGQLVVDEVPGLALALARPGTPVTVEVRLTSGHSLVIDLLLPDVVSAICLKAYAYAGRFTPRDAVDLWRLLEAAAAARVTAATWPTGAAAADAAAILGQHFGRPGAQGPTRASARQADQTRIRALVALVVGRV
ncbi:hypothetical protein GCM10023328_48130 [Modestobacter marinus]|uniref:Nucleotidyltransferase AbiEii toxin of type IV toxin-antitoxin system n=1 Tax=Modestobacter marinus TaxID=477641 RepID=A0ABQ2GB96_9ACTN|nr:hypothetical protein [Modestobacter marinus]GGL83854.1 hypothetical protein GCM10011589_45310 [Modestobacter marinus]